MTTALLGLGAGGGGLAALGEAAAVVAPPVAIGLGVTVVAVGGYKAYQAYNAPTQTQPAVQPEATVDPNATPQYAGESEHLDPNDTSMTPMADPSPTPAASTPQTSNMDAATTPGTDTAGTATPANTGAGTTADAAAAPATGTDTAAPPTAGTSQAHMDSAAAADSPAAGDKGPAAAAATTATPTKKKKKCATCNGKDQAASQTAAPAASGALADAGAMPSELGGMAGSVLGAAQQAMPMAMTMAGAMPALPGFTPAESMPALPGFAVADPMPALPGFTPAETMPALPGFTPLGTTPDMNVVTNEALGDLTSDEISTIQKGADALGSDIYITGSAAQARRRGIGSDLPLAGFGESKVGTKSDIDYAVANKDDLDSRANELGLPDVDPSFGVRALDYITLDKGPIIKFSPGQEPTVLNGTGRMYLND